MKKLIAIAVVFALAAGAAFAQVKDGITVGGAAEAKFVPFVFAGPVYFRTGDIRQVESAGTWDSNGIYVPGAMADDKGDVYTGIYGYKVQANIAGASDYAAFTFNFKVDRSTGGNNTYIVRNDGNFWVQPFGNGMLRISFQSGGNAGLGGNNGESFDSMGLTDYTVKHDANSSGGGNGNIFTGFADSGIAITSDGIMPGLSFGVAVPDLNFSGSGWDSTTTNNVFANAWRKVQIAAGYKIPDIGHIRLGYFGGWAENINFNSLTEFQHNYLYGGAGVYNELTVDPDDVVGTLPYGTAYLQAAFRLQAVAGLDVDIGAKLILNQTGTFTDNSTTPADKYTMERVGGVNIGLGVKYTLDAFSVGFSLHTNQLGRGYTYTRPVGLDDALTTKYEAPVLVTMHLAPQYVIDGTTIGFDLGVFMSGESVTTVSGSDTDTTNGVTTGQNSQAIKSTGWMSLRKKTMARSQ